MPPPLKAHIQTILVDKVVHSGNGATQNSGGRPLCCHRHAWSALRWQTYSPTVLSKQKPHWQELPGASVPIHLYSLDCLSASFMNIACVPGVQLPESIWTYWTPTCESNHKVYIQEQGRYGHLRGAAKITSVICSPGSKQSGNIRG